MSLINEALKRARIEAARRDAAEQGVPAAALPVYVPERRRPWLAPLVGFLVGLGSVALAAGAFWYFSRSSAPSGSPTAVATTAESAAPSPSTPPDPSVSSGGEVVPPAVGAGGGREPGSPRLESREPERTLAEPASDGSQERSARAGQESSPPPRPREAFRPEERAFAEAERTGEPIASETRERLVAPDDEPELEEVATERDPRVAEEPSPGAGSLGGTASAASSPAPPPTPTTSSGESAEADGADRGVGSEQTFLREADLPGGVRVKLDFIVWSETRPFAQINGELVNPGQLVGSYVLRTIERDRIGLEDGDGGMVWVRAK